MAGQMRTIFGIMSAESTYFQQYNGYYFAGDECRRDEDGYYWITGRVDDVINVSGHRMGLLRWRVHWLLMILLQSLPLLVST